MNNCRGISILFSGDVMLSRGVSPKIEEIGVADFMIRDVTTLLFGNDVTCLNLECPITHEKPISNGFGAKAAYLDFIPQGTIANLANNHILDCGFKGLADTLGYLSKRGILPIGVIGKLGDKSYKGFVSVPVRQKRVSFFGVTAHKFFKKTGTSSDDLRVLCFEDSDILQQTVIDAIKVSDYIIGVIHDGTEFTYYPDVEYKNRCKHLLDLGCDCVVGHHSHVFSGYEYTNNNKKVIFYSLGDFIFDGGTSMRRQSAILNITLEEDAVKHQLYPIRIDDNCRPVLASRQKQQKFIKKVDRISKRIGTQKFNKSSKKWIRGDVYTYQFLRVLFLLRKKGLASTLAFIISKLR